MSIIKISDHANIGSKYRYYKQIIQLTILIIDYRMVLFSNRMPVWTNVVVFLVQA
jgi:hypothetical protein